MDLKDIMRIGQLCSIEIKDEQELTIKHPSRVENMTKNTVMLASPIRNRIPIYIAPGEKVKVWFWDCFTSYTFESLAVKSINKDIPLVIVKHPDKIVRVQKREYVRVQYSIDVKLKWTGNDGEHREIICGTRDLSGGGVMLVSTKRLQLNNNDDVYVEFTIDGEIIKSAGVVVWNDCELDSDGIKRNTLGLKFTTLTEKERRFLVRSVYKRQIELRRKGLI